jgi:UDP-glucose 4-epimerase
MSTNKILVTGASGFIGTHLIRALLDRGYDVYGVSRSQPKVSDSRLRFESVDLTDSGSVRKTFESIRPDLVYHLASYAQGERNLELVLPTFTGELTTSINVLTSATEFKTRRVVMAGSLEESDSSEVPSSPYAAAKMATRLYAKMFYELYKLPIVFTRIFMVYGPGQSSKKLISHSIATLLRGETLKIGSPDRRVDWIYIKDVVAGLLAVAETPGIEGTSVDLGSGELVDIRYLVNRLREIINPEATIEFGALPPRTGEVVRVADAEAAYKATGFRTKVALTSGLFRTVEEFRNAV